MKTLQAIPRSLKTDFVFYNPDTNKRFGDIKRSFNTAMRRAGVRDFTFHDLRHTFASHSIMAGISISTLSKILGHKSLAMTMRYAHLAPDHLKEEIKKLEIFTNTATDTKTDTLFLAKS